MHAPCFWGWQLRMQLWQSVSAGWFDIFSSESVYLEMPNNYQGCPKPRVVLTNPLTNLWSLISSIFPGWCKYSWSLFTFLMIERIRKSHSLSLSFSHYLETWHIAMPNGLSSMHISSLFAIICYLAGNRQVTLVFSSTFHHFPITHQSEVYLWYTLVTQIYILSVARVIVHVFLQAMIFW